MKPKEKVFVGLSGGVDSSVAAKRLIDQGYDVTGVFIKVWHPDFLVCNWEQERLDAMRVAAHLNIPFLTCDAEVAYRDSVADYFISEYKQGRTPNPDVMCNRYVKFGEFLRFAREHGADYIATGHYGQIIDGKLHRGVDENKDQSYFLWTLTNEQLKSVLLPIGDTKKDQVREEAAQAGLPTAQKSDSQGICFLGHVDIADFLSHYVDLKPGKVVNEEGKEIGTHQGALIYTKGQRHGLLINTKEEKRAVYYVVGKDITKNIVYVALESPKLEAGTKIKITDLVLREELNSADKILVQTRYRQAPSPAIISHINSEYLELTLETVAEDSSIGQSAVFYRDSLCLGGGIIAGCT